MEAGIIERGAFSVIGREGSTDEGAGFIQRLWDEANAHYGEIAALVKAGEGGAPAGLWGAMSDMGRTYAPWEDDFSRGLYLAGAEVICGAEPPAGWVRWTLPARRWLMLPVKCDAAQSFRAGLDYIAAHGMRLCGAACDFIDPAENGRAYTAFPVECVNTDAEVAG